MLLRNCLNWQFFHFFCFYNDKGGKGIFMTYPINQSKNPYLNQPAMGVSPQLQNVNVDKEKIRQTVNDNPVSKVTEHSNPWLTAGIFLPTWLLVHLGMQKFSQSSQGEYSKSIIGRAEAFGEKISSSSAFNNPVAKSTKNLYQKALGFVNKNIIDKSQILKSMFRTPAIPENHSVLTMSGGISAEISSSATQLFEKFTKNGADLDKIIELGFNKGTASKPIADVEKYKDYVKNSHKYTKEIEEICLKQGNKSFHVERGGKIPFSKYFSKTKTPMYITDLIPQTKIIFARDVHFSEYANKLKGSKKGLSRLMLRVIEGMTNAGAGASGGGAIIASVMGAWFIVDAVTRTIKAPKGKGEKRKTFAENMAYNLGFYMTMPLAVKSMFGMGGLQYIGMSKEEVAKYREKLAAFNKNVVEEKYTKAEYKVAKKELNDMLKGTTKINKTDKFATKLVKGLKNIAYKPLKLFGRMSMVGLEGKRGFRAPGAGKTAKFFADFGFKMKDMASYPVRLLGFMLIFAPFFAKFFAKGSHLIFGKPTVSVLDEGKEDKQAQQTAPSGAQPVRQVSQVASAPLPTAANTSEVKKSDEIYPLTNGPITQPKAYFKENSATPPMNPTAGVGSRSMIQGESTNLIDRQKQGSSMIASEATKRTYSYMPSSDGVKLSRTQEQATKDEKYNKMMNKAEKAEKNADKYLH